MSHNLSKRLENSHHKNTHFTAMIYSREILRSRLDLCHNYLYKNALDGL